MKKKAEVWWGEYELMHKRRVLLEEKTSFVVLELVVKNISNFNFPHGTALKGKQMAVKNVIQDLSGLEIGKEKIVNISIQKVNMSVSANTKYHFMFSIESIKDDRYKFNDFLLVIEKVKDGVYEVESKISKPLKGDIEHHQPQIGQYSSGWNLCTTGGILGMIKQ